MVRPCSRPSSKRCLCGAPKTRSAPWQKLSRIQSPLSASISARTRFIARDGRFKKVTVLFCENDATVIAEAKKLLDDEDIEVWHLDRMVVRLEHDEQ